LEGEMKKPRPSAVRARAAKTAAVTTPASAIAAEAAPAKKPFNPLQFFNEVRAEGRKITWPSRKETWITSVMVFIMVAISAVFFFVVDIGLGFLINFILKFSTGQ